MLSSLKKQDLPSGLNWDVIEERITQEELYLKRQDQFWKSMGHSLLSCCFALFVFKNVQINKKALLPNVEPSFVETPMQLVDQPLSNVKMYWVVRNESE